MTLHLPRQTRPAPNSRPAAREAPESRQTGGSGTDAERRQLRRAGERLERRERRRETGGIDYQDFVDRLLPAVDARYELCEKLEAAIRDGTEQAIPELIVTATTPPADPYIARYCRKYIADLEVTCLNWGIDPTTGGPDQLRARALIESLRAGKSEYRALRAANLAAHPTIPAVLLRDPQIRAAVEQARYL